MQLVYLNLHQEEQVQDLQLTHVTHIHLLQLVSAFDLDRPHFIIGKYSG